MVGTELVWPPRISSAMLGDERRRGARVCDVESLAPLACVAVSRAPRAGRSGGSPAQAAVPVVLNGRIDPPGDDDRFVLAVTPGQRLRIKVQASELGSALDGVLRVLGNGGSVLANADDTTIAIPVRRRPAGRSRSSCPTRRSNSRSRAAPTRSPLVMRDLEDRGGIGFPYRIVVEPLFPDFELQVNEPQVSVPRGGTAAVGVTVRRKGYSGPITLDRGRPARGPDGAGRARSPPARPPACSRCRRRPTPRFPPARSSSSARARDRMGRSSGSRSSRSSMPSRRLCPPARSRNTAWSPPPPCARRSRSTRPLAPIEVAHGFSATIPVKVTRTKGSDGALAISPLPLPPGLTIGNATIADKATEGKVTVKAALAAPWATMTVGLQAKGKFAGAERTFALPAVTLTVVPPAAVELARAGRRDQAGSDRSSSRERSSARERSTAR